MKKTLLFIMLVAHVATAQETQQSTTDSASSLSVWKHIMIVSTSITQVSFTNWTQGGENTLAYSVFLDGKSVYIPNTPIEWTNSYKLGFGQARLSTLGLRKTDDIINFESVILYKIGSYINPFASASLKTQFTKGYKYDNTGASQPVSNFFDPAYLVQAIGVGVQPLQELRTRIGVAIREIITNQYTIYSDDPSTVRIEKTRIDGGAEFVTDIVWKILENTVVTSKLEIFVPMKSIKRSTFRNDMTVSAKANKYIAVTVNVLLINDPQIQQKTQIKETLALGISFSLL